MQRAILLIAILAITLPLQPLFSLNPQFFVEAAAVRLDSNQDIPATNNSAPFSQKEESSVLKKVSRWIWGDQRAALLSNIRTAFEDGRQSENIEPAQYTRVLNISNFFPKHHYNLQLNAPLRFREMRASLGINETDYQTEVAGAWRASADTGLSGSFFLHSQNKKLMLKSLPKRFEYRFLNKQNGPDDAFLVSYTEYIRKNPHSLLNKILDVVYSNEVKMWDLWRNPTQNYIVLENLAKDHTGNVTIHDYKPDRFFEPYRDLWSKIVPTSGITQLIKRGMFGFLRALTKHKILPQLKKDLNFLQSHDIVDYSLLVISSKGKVSVGIIDFLWSNRFGSRKWRKRAAKGLMLPEMTVTADSSRYAQEFYNMTAEVLG